MAGLPTGTVTFLFTDIEGSTRLLQALGDRYPSVLAQHRQILRSAVNGAGGHEVDTEGDTFFAAFVRARDALHASIIAQRLIATHLWPGGLVIKLRMGLHTGQPMQTDTGYAGIDVHHAARIRAVAHGGQILLSSASAELVADDLPDSIALRDLGRHRLKDLSRPQRLFQVVAPGLAADFPPLRTLEAVPHNLPVQLTSFIGREREMAEVKVLLREARLLTLTGVGGSGKTRLALQVAAEVLDDHQDGVRFVELGGVMDERFVPQSVASALGVREQPGRPILDTLVDDLQTKSALIILDNCEHIIGACGVLAEALLRRCLGLRILATSREGLAIGGERLYVVPPLPIPDVAETTSAAALERSHAVQLFLDRARAVVSTFRLDERNAEAVAQICRRLDGMPLAIELAAPRVRVLSPQQIAERLHDRFKLLTGGSRTAVPRQQTLQAAIDWSHDLLPEKEKVLFRRLGVFVSGWTLEAAEAACAGEGLDRSEVLSLLEHLVGRSLVVTEEQEGEARYRYLETTRQYARDRLVEAGEAERLRRAHRDFFEASLERIVPEEGGVTQGPQTRLIFDRLERDHDNIRATLEWSLESDPTGESAATLIWFLWWFWEVRGHYREGRAWVDAALKASAGKLSLGRARILYVGGRLAHMQGDLAAARPLLEESVDLARRFEEKALPGRRSVKAIAIWYLANVRWGLASYAEAIELYEEAIRLARRPTLASVLMINLAELVATVGDYGKARTLLEDGVALGRQNPSHRAHFAFALAAEGDLAWMDGDYRRSRERHEEALAIYRGEFGGAERKGIGIGWRLSSLGLLAREQGQYDQARSLHEEALAIYREVGAQHQVAWALHAHGTVERDQAHLERARELYEESQSIMKGMERSTPAAIIASDLGEVALYRKDYAAAGRSLEASIETFRSVSNRRMTGISLMALARLARAMGDAARSWSLLREAFQLCWEGIHRLRKVGWMETYAGMATDLGQPEMGARVLGTAEAARGQMGTPLPPVDREAHDITVDGLAGVLGRDRFEALRQEGRRMTIEDSVSGLR